MIVATVVGVATVGGTIRSIHRGIDIAAAHSIWLVFRPAANVASMGRDNLPRRGLCIPLEITMNTSLKTAILPSKLRTVTSIFTLVCGTILASTSATAESPAGFDPARVVAGLSVVGAQDIVPDTAPLVIETAEIQYPARAMDKGLDGWVIVEIDIDENGMPYNAKIVRSEASPLLRRPALKALKKYRFIPATLNGNAVGVEGKRYKITYALLDG